MELNEEEVIACNPFEGDFGEPGDITLKDKMGIARKSGPCHLCGMNIKPKERVRLRTDISCGDIMSFRWCNACCHAMALSWEDWWGSELMNYEKWQLVRPRNLPEVPGDNKKG